jgi:hypothetical protein
LSKINIWPSFESWKGPKNHEIGPISNLDSVKSTNPKAIAIFVNYKMIYNLNFQSISNKSERSYAKPAKSVKNALFVCTHFLRVILGDPVRPLKWCFLVDCVQNSYSRKINECQSLNPFVFLLTYKKVTGGKF